MTDNAAKIFIPKSRRTPHHRLQDRDFGKDRGRRLYRDTPTTDNAAKIFIPKIEKNISP